MAAVRYSVVAQPAAMKQCGNKQIQISYLRSTILISFFLSVVHDMAKPVTADERFALITRGLREVLGGDSIKAILNEGRNPKCYWGT